MIGQYIQRDMMLRRERAAAQRDLDDQASEYEHALARERRNHAITKQNLRETTKEAQGYIDARVEERDAALARVAELEAALAATAAERDAYRLEAEAHLATVDRMAEIDPENAWFNDHPHYVSEEGAPMTAYATMMTNTWHARRAAEFPHVDEHHIGRVIERAGAADETGAVLPQDA